TYMKGKVYDAKTNDPLEARFELVDLSTSQPVIESYSDKINGQFLVNIATNRQYALAVEKDGYWFFSKNFSFPETKDKEKIYLMDVPLIPISVNDTTPILLDNVFFDTDKFDLRPESYVELDKLVFLLKRNDKTKIELHGHTDNVGDKKHNLTLSLNRAKAVMNYLVTKGIDAKRLSAKGFGDTRPKVANDTPENRQINRRTEYIPVK
ncbi:MAG: OmpA family protein, partial [Flavobacteriales bacterium]